MSSSALLTQRRCSKNQEFHHSVRGVILQRGAGDLQGDYNGQDVWCQRILREEVPSLVGTYEGPKYQGGAGDFESVDTQWMSRQLFKLRQTSPDILARRGVAAPFERCYSLSRG